LATLATAIGDSLSTIPIEGSAPPPGWGTNLNDAGDGSSLRKWQRHDSPDDARPLALKSPKARDAALHVGCRSIGRRAGRRVLGLHNPALLAHSRMALSGLRQGAAAGIEAKHARMAPELGCQRPSLLTLPPLSRAVHNRTAGVHAANQRAALLQTARRMRCS